MTKYATLISRQIISLIIIGYAFGFWRSANRLPPGPHVVYPEIIIVVLVAIIAADVFIHTLRLLSSREPLPVLAMADDEEYDGPSHWPAAPLDAIKLAVRSQHRILVMFIATLLLTYSIPRVGFFETVFVFLLAGYWFLGLRRIRTLLLVWASTSFVIWFLFTQLLVVPRVPRGILRAWLF
jgi:hypothetical protein